jgi:Uma2 family endonuclease
MTMLIKDPQFEESLIHERQVLGIDQHDEVWDGVYVMPPLASNDHQRVVGWFFYVLQASITIPGLGEALPGTNLAASADDWTHDFRVPDVAVFMLGSKAENHKAFWTGAADFLIEVTSPQEDAEEKIPFYSRVGVRELLVVDQEDNSLDLYRHDTRELVKVGSSMLPESVKLSSEVVPLDFRMVLHKEQILIEVSHQQSGQTWVF